MIGLLNLSFNNNLTIKSLNAHVDISAFVKDFTSHSFQAPLDYDFALQRNALFDPFILLILVCYSRSHTSIYLRECIKCLTRWEQRTIVFGFTQSIRATRREYVSQTQYHHRWRDSSYAWVASRERAVCPNTQGLIYGARRWPPYFYVRSLEEEWMARDVNVVCPRPTRNCSNDFRLGRASWLRGTNSTLPRINNN